MMNILVVAVDKGGRFAPFVEEQMTALSAAGCEVDRYYVHGKGIVGYLRNLKALRHKIATYRPDVVHAHYGLTGLLCCLQRRVPVVVTYHGTDINNPRSRRFSRFAMRLSAWNIFVSRRLADIVAPTDKYTIQPCGINLPKPQEECPDMNGALRWSRANVLFAGAFDNGVKDPQLAQDVAALLPNIHLIELKGYTRDEVYGLMYICDALLMTSRTEGSPQVIKEAMACGLPIVSTDVGDVRERLDGLDRCHVVDSRDPQVLARIVNKLTISARRTEGRQRIIQDGLTNDQIAQKLIAIYKNIISQR